MSMVIFLVYLTGMLNGCGPAAQQIKVEHSSQQVIDVQPPRSIAQHHHLSSTADRQRYRHVWSTAGLPVKGHSTNKGTKKRKRKWIPEPLPSQGYITVSPSMGTPTIHPRR